MKMSDTRTQKSDGVWIIDDMGRTLYANERMCDILRTTSSAISGRDSFDFLYPEDVTAAGRLFSQKQAGSSAPFHFKLRREDGSPIWVDVQGTPMQNAAGEFIGIVGTFTVSKIQEA